MKTIKSLVQLVHTLAVLGLLVWCALLASAAGKTHSRLQDLERQLQSAQQEIGALSRNAETNRVRGAETRKDVDQLLQASLLEVEITAARIQEENERDSRIQRLERTLEDFAEDGQTLVQHHKIFASCLLQVDSGAELNSEARNDLYQLLGLKGAE